MNPCTMTTVSALLATSTFAQLCAGWLAVLPIVALAIHGWWNGVFLATIAGLQVVASSMAAVAWARPLAAQLEPLGCPASQSLAAAYALIFVAGIVVTRLAVGAAVGPEACRLQVAADRAWGMLAGAWAGVILAGALLVGWSMTGMPEWSRFDSSHLPIDAGHRVLWTFARWAAPANVPWQALLDGEPPAGPADAAAGSRVRASEPFVDGNGNGLRDGAPADAAERYLDVDGNGRFTEDLAWQDANEDGKRNLGLGELYRLADWRLVKVRYAPRITSPATAEIRETHPIDDPIYRATAMDLDPGDSATFSLKPPSDGSGDDFVIDPVTGEVRLAEPPDFERRKHYVFVVVATDMTGIATEQEVRLRVLDVPLE